MRDITLKIALIQDQPGSWIRDVYRDILIDKKPDLIAFPEYFFVLPFEKNVISSSIRQYSILEEIKKWSVDLGCAIIGGTVVSESNGKLYNRSYLIDKGEVIGYYDKIHPFRNEGRGLIEKGTEYRVFNILGAKIGILICADVLYPHTYHNLVGLKPELIFVPTTSPYRENESARVKFARDNRLFVKGARSTGAIIFKVCASGELGGRRLQARSLIASADGVLWRNLPDDEDKSALIFAGLQNPGGHTRLDIQVYRR